MTKANKKNSSWGMAVGSIVGLAVGFLVDSSMMWVPLTLMIGLGAGALYDGIKRK